MHKGALWFAVQSNRKTAPYYAYCANKPTSHTTDVVDYLILLYIYWAIYMIALG